MSAPVVYDIGSLAHRKYVRQLYRRSLKLASDWFVRRTEFREKALIIRKMFDQNKNVTSPQQVQRLLLITEHNITANYHPSPYISPTAPGGSKWERNTPFPEELIKRGSEKEAVKVIVRCRPFSEKEKIAGHSSIVNIDKQAATVSISDPRSSEPSNIPKIFTFDSVFDNTCSQMEVYNACARPIVDSVLQGYNGTVFAYGQTGTGKTFSMEGIRDVPHLRGIIPNSFEHIFNHIRLSPTSSQYLVRASYLEIYNEDIRDLLNPNKGKLEVKERADTGVYVKDLSTFVVKDVEEMDRLMAVGNKYRSVGATNMNEQSSRSHSIFTITIEVSETPEEGENTAKEGEEDARIRAGKLHLVDLAGSERQSKTGAAGDRLKEATKINLSLSALGNVISALVDGKSSHIPYRDSKLTRLLQDSLGGNARTLMLATMSPASYNYDETISTLRYANRAKNIKNKPKVNEDPKDAMLREFQEEIKKLKAELESMEGCGTKGQIIQEIVEEEEVIEEEEEEEEAQMPSDEKPAQAKQAAPPKVKIQKVKKPKKEKIPDQPPETAGPASETSASNHSLNASRPHATIPESQLAEMQRLVEAEKKAITESKDMEETEKNRLLAEANQRSLELEQEKNVRGILAQKLEQLQQKLLVGGVNILDKDAEQKMLLARQAQELEERQRLERELHRELEEHEETNLQIEEEYASLQEEAAAKGRKLKKLWNLITAAKSEVKDLQEEHQREREDLLETIRDLTRELKLRLLVVNSFVPADDLQMLESCAEYDEAAEKWRIAHIAHAGNNIRGKRSLVSGQPLGLHRDYYSGANRKEESDDMWNPLCVFPDVYLVYDVPSSPVRKKSDIKKSSADKSPSKKVRPSSAAGTRKNTSKTGSAQASERGYGRDGSRSPTKLASEIGRSMSRAERNNDTSLETAHPAARGLVAKNKHYA
ncbi:Kinesin-like protein kif3b [Nowakowskiella sp. JEL0078]|nr:Kinesin-like protein kif3b [Nowakowskiella sp. JEL0078]